MTNKIKTVDIDDDLNEDNKKLLKLSEIPWRDYIAEQNYGTDINTMCEECIAEQIAKHGSRVIPCKGLAEAESQLGEETYKALTKDASKEEVELLDAIYDPYAYMEAYLDIDKKGKPGRRFSRRWYQERVVKCLSGTTDITMSDNSTKYLKDIEVGDTVKSTNQALEIVSNKVINKWVSGTKQTYKVFFEDGSYLVLTEDHPVLVHVQTGCRHTPKGVIEYKSIIEGLLPGMRAFKESHEEALTFKTIIGIEEYREELTYDIEVEDTHNFLANNTVVHNCTAQSKVVRMGRRCIPGYETILKSDGKLEEIQNIKVGDSVVSYRNGEVVHNKVIDKWENGVKPVYRIKLTDGRSLDCTENHPLLVRNPSGGTSWKSIEDGLSINDEVMVLNKYDKFGTYSNTDEAKLLGYLLSDGYISDKINQTPKFTSCTKDYLDEVQSIVERLFGYKCRYVTDSNSKGVDLYLTDGDRGSKNKVKEWLKKNDLLGTKYKNKKIMKYIEKFDRESMSYFINRLWAGDGCISLWERKNRPNGLAVEASLTTSNYELVYKLRNILYKLGITARISTERRKSPSSENVGVYWKLRISDKSSIQKFLAFTGPIYGKEDNSHKALKEVAKRKNALIQHDSQFFPRKIKSIEYIEDMETYDITIEKDHNFIVNSIVTHNTGKTFALAILILHRLLTNQNYRVLLVSPFAVQTEEVVDNIKNLCTLLPENPLVSSKASPNHVLTFNTGSVLKGFTASVDANSVRGQPGHLLVLDEVDDIPEKAMISIMGIKMDNDEVEIWRSGTPKGEVNLHKAEMDPTTKAFHYPSFVIPHYSDKLDRELREELGEIGFVQETMAEFGLVSNGVFQSMFIQKAQQRAQFITQSDVFKDRNRYILVIGVDWNHDQVGTRIVVIAYDKLNPQFKIVEKAEVAVVGYTQQAAMEKVIHLNRKYNVDHIFCDEGFGITQIGDLKRVGEAAIGTVPKGHPDLKLLDVQAVNFSSNTEIRDPVSGEMYKIPTKQFAVQNTTVMLERDLLSLHPKEDNDIILQMKNYIEKSRNKGKIVYSYISKKIGDHDLDALMIGLYGYRKIYSNLFEGSVFQAMIKFVDKNENSNAENTHAISEDILGYAPIKFSSARPEVGRNKALGMSRTDRSRFK